MLVMVKSSPESTEGKRGIELAMDMATDLILIQNAVYFSQKSRLQSFGGTVYALGEDMRLRGISSDGTGSKIKEIDYDKLVDLMTKEEKVFGAF
ncbi:MAG TPA: sulfurtransferase complex subunit TusB [Nitrospirota bacterium]|nr:sulfurtransferase complex subunit TusB [Nitrospirota bacterium]